MIEEPASIVKELLENAIDASADDITVELEKADVTLYGSSTMAPASMPTTFLWLLSGMRQAKYTSLTTFTGVRSFGFRGEALPSIASIALWR